MIILLKGDHAFLEALYAYFRTLQICNYANLASKCTCAVAHLVGTLEMVFCLTMGEVKPDNIQAGLKHFIKHFLLVRSRTEGCNNLGASWHIVSCLCLASCLTRDYFARSSSMATAGSFLPSRNSRKAPPPVEM